MVEKRGIDQNYFTEKKKKTWREVDGILKYILTYYYVKGNVLNERTVFFVRSNKMNT